MHHKHCTYNSYNLVQVTERYNSLIEKQLIKIQHIYDVMIVIEVVVIIIVKIDLFVVKIVQLIVKTVQLIMKIV